MTDPTMRAVTWREGRLGLHEIPRPVPGKGQILVRTLACAVCASTTTTWTTRKWPATTSPARVCTPPTSTW